MPTSTNFDDIRKWHNHYGTGGALYNTWSLGQTELRYMAEKPSGTISLNDFDGRIGYLAKDPAHISTTVSDIPGRTKITLMSNPRYPIYESYSDTYGFGDPMGNCLYTRQEGGQGIYRAVFSATYFYYNRSRPLTISFDFMHRTTMPDPQFNVVIVEQRSRFGDSTNRVMHSEMVSDTDNNKIQSFSTTINFGVDYPYKVISLQNNTGGSGALSSFNNIFVANMRITE